jgi:hypothetical protein
MTESPNEFSSQDPDGEGAKDERRAATDGTKEELLHVVRGRLKGAGRYINPCTRQGYVVRDSNTAYNEKRAKKRKPNDKNKTDLNNP